MKKMIGKLGAGSSLVLLLALLVSCLPVTTSADSTLPSPTGSDVVELTMPTIRPTGTSTATLSPSVTSILTPTLLSTPSATQRIFLLPSPTVVPTRTRPTQRQNTPTASNTPTSERTATGTPPSKTATATRCPIPTAEPFSVEPVTSPTDQLSQIVTVYIGNGEAVTIITESGTFTTTGTPPAPVEITLLPNTVHHLEVFAKVKTVVRNGCVYGGYTLRTTFDYRGAPLIIEQRMPSYP